MKKNNNLLIEKLFFIYEAMLELENIEGPLIIIKHLEERAIKGKTAKRLKITKKRLNKFLEKLTELGVIFYPTGETVERLAAYNYWDKEIKKSRKKGYEN